MAEKQTTLEELRWAATINDQLYQEFRRQNEQALEDAAWHYGHDFEWLGDALNAADETTRSSSLRQLWNSSGSADMTHLRSTFAECKAASCVNSFPETSDDVDCLLIDLSKATLEKWKRDVHASTLTNKLEAASSSTIIQPGSSVAGASNDESSALPAGDYWEPGM